MNGDPTNDPERRWETNATPVPEFDMGEMGANFGKSVAEEIEKDIVVDHPPHYNNRKMEAIDIIEMIIEIEKNPKVAYNMSNVLKYLLRFRDKGTAVRDLQKAGWYLQRMIEKIEEEKSE